MSNRKEILGFSKSMLFQCILLYIGIWGGLVVSPYVFLVVAGMTVITSLFAKIEATYYHLFFLLSFTTIFKFSPSSTSVFAYLMIVTAAILILRQRWVQKLPIILIMLFFVYAAVGMGSNYTTALKMVAGLLLLYVFVLTASQENFKNYIFAFSLGVLGSSIIGTMKESWERLSVYFENLDYIYFDGEQSARFTGLNYDPNYYAIGVIIALFLLIRLLMNKEANRLLLVVIIGVLAFFGFTSYSKTFLLCVVFMGVLLILGAIRTPKHFLISILSFGIVVFLFIYWAENSGYFIVMDQRFSGDISTGRFDVWKKCWDHIWGSPKTLLFGDGLGYQIFEPHNAYLELILIFGILGGGIVVFTVVYILALVRKTQKRTFLDYGLIILFLTMIATLGMVTMNELMFYFSLLYVSLNISKTACDIKINKKFLQS